MRSTLAFVAGTDIAQFQNFNHRDDGLKYEERLDHVLDRLERVTKPTIAQVEGVAAGGGCAIALTCDLRVATPEATFGIPIARTLGNCLSGASYSRLLDVMSPGTVKDMLFTGRLIGAAEAQARWGSQPARARRRDRGQHAVDAARDKGNDPPCPGEASSCAGCRRRHGRDVLHERGLPRRGDRVSRQAPGAARRGEAHGPTATDYSQGRADRRGHAAVPAQGVVRMARIAPIDRPHRRRYRVARDGSQRLGSARFVKGREVPVLANLGS